MLQPLQAKALAGQHQYFAQSLILILSVGVEIIQLQLLNTHRVWYDFGIPFNTSFPKDNNQLFTNFIGTVFFHTSNNRGYCSDPVCAPEGLLCHKTRSCKFKAHQLFPHSSKVYLTAVRQVTGRFVFILGHSLTCKIFSHTKDSSNVCCLISSKDFTLIKLSAMFSWTSKVQCQQS